LDAIAIGKPKRDHGPAG